MAQTKYFHIFIVCAILQITRITASFPVVVSEDLDPAEICQGYLDECDDQPRHILFIVDGSLSIDPERYYNEMLDYVQRLYCAFEPKGSQAGLITFNGQIRRRIPLGNYSRAEWINKIEELRDRKANQQSCCTPHAEAFEKAVLEFEDNPIDANSDVQRVAFVITDGKPYQNYGQGPYQHTKMQRSYYVMKKVPEAAQAIKDLDVRLMLVVVPSKDGKETHEDYFMGLPEGEQECSTLKKQELCLTLEQPPFPIISTPVESNVFGTNDWDMPALMDLTIDRICNSAWVPTCKGPPRDILFVVDSSNSMDPERFYGEMLDVVLNLFNSLDQRKPNRVGLLLFSYNARVVIPIAQYKPTEFRAQILKIREDRDQCCSCCTPTAEAFYAASEEFVRAGDTGNDRILFMVTDGVPYQLKNGEFSQGKEAKSTYLYKTVPEGAQAVKDQGVRVVLVGVPNKFLQPPNENYFRGEPIGQEYCVKFKKKQVCQTIQHGEGLFPIVSSPANANIFTATSWNIKQLTQDMYGLLCKAYVANPTTEPVAGPVETPRPTPKPVTGPVETPSPTPKPTNPSPTPKPTTSSPTLNPTEFIVRTTYLADGGADLERDEPAECVIPFTFKGEEFTECASMDTHEPYIPTGYALVDPTVNETKSHKWCPTVAAYKKNDVSVRKKWGYCLEIESTRAPTTVPPTSDPTTAEPSPKPTTVPPTPEPTTDSPTTSAPTKANSNTDGPTPEVTTAPTKANSNTDEPTPGVTNAPTTINSQNTPSPTSTGCTMQLSISLTVVCLLFQFVYA